MTPFQEFRLWARRAPAAERIGTSLVAVLAVALVGWMIVPGSASSNKSALSARGSTRSGQAQTTGSAASTADGSATGTNTPIQSAGTGGAGGGGGGGTGQRRWRNGGGHGRRARRRATSCPTGNAPGVSDTEIKIAVTLTNVVGPAANSIFGIPTPAEQQADFDALIDSLNQEGGVACRKLVREFYSANPVDQNALQQTCLDIKQSGAFAVVDTGAWAVPGPMCFAQNQVPYFGGYLITQKQGEQGFPYLFDLGQFDRLFRDAVHALNDRGFYQQANGFQKLGIIYHDCYPELIAQTIDALHQSGVTDAQIVTYNFGCPATFATPSDVAQAVLKFKTSGVTHATEVAAVGDLQNFTTIAEQQTPPFRPKWGLADDQVVGTAYGSQPPNANNIANALIITQSRNGEERTDGVTPTAGTVKCDSWFTAHGLAPTYQQPPLAGNACDQLLMLKAAVENAATIAVDALADGLQHAGSIDFSYPQGPNDFSGGVTTGGQFWRTAQFFGDCKCWKLIESDFHPTYG